jgi:hypothetical protein
MNYFFNNDSCFLLMIKVLNILENKILNKALIN